MRRTGTPAGPRPGPGIATRAGRPVGRELVAGRDLTAQRSTIRPAIAALTAVAVVAVVVAHRGAPLVGLLLAPVVVCYGALSIVDAGEQRLPNRITLPLAGASAAAVVVAGLARSDPVAALGALGGGLAFALFLLVLRFGMGDVKLAFTIGTIAAWLGRDAVVATVYVAAASGASVALVLMIVHRRRHLTFGFGPFLAIGSVAGMVAAGL